MKLFGDKRFAFAALIGMLPFILAGCGGGDPIQSYPVSADVGTTRQNTIAFPALSSATRLDQVAQLMQEGFGAWSPGPGIDDGKRTDLMPDGYDGSAVTKKTKLLNFFAMTDVHITDKESPSQPIYLQSLHPRVISAYSPVMLYSTHVLDAAIQTVNALHKTNPIDFGISLGDVANNTQYNELRQYIDVIDGKVIYPSSGAHVGQNTIDYQKPFKAAGLDKSIPWYQAIGNHDHFWVGTNPIDAYLKQSYISDTVIALGDVLSDPQSIEKRDYYMGVLDGSTPYGDIKYAGPVGNFPTPPKVVADPDRRSLTRSDWMKEFLNTSTSPSGHGFKQANVDEDFANYSFLPKSNLPIKVIVIDNTQNENDANVNGYGHGSLDKKRYDWLVQELEAGQANGQLMIIAAHIPLGVEPTNDVMYPAPHNTIPKSFIGWSNSVSYVTEAQLVAKLQSYPNLLMWISGHRHLNVVKAFKSPDPVNYPERGFWQVETSSLREFPQQFRTFEISLNSDYTVSIVTTNVDPAVIEGTPAAISRKYAVMSQQKALNNITQATSPVPDVSIRQMPTGSYNAELVKKLSPEMVNRLKALY